MVISPFVTGATNQNDSTAVIEELKRERKKTVHPVVLAEEWKLFLVRNSEISVKEIALYQGFSESRVNQLIRLTKLAAPVKVFLSKLSNSEDIRFYGERNLRHILQLEESEQIRKFIALRKDGNMNLFQNKTKQRL